MQPERNQFPRHVRHSRSPAQLSFLADLFGDYQPSEDSGNIISFDEIAEKHQRKIERKTYSIILDNISHLRDKSEK